MFTSACRKGKYVHWFCTQSNCKDLNTSGSDAHINARIRIVNKHRNVADKLGWEPRRKYATARFSIGFCALETNSSRDRTDRHSLLLRWNVITASDCYHEYWFRMLHAHRIIF